MKRLFFIFLVGMCLGAMRWVSFYETHGNPRVFTELSLPQTRQVLARMIRMQQFERVKLFLHSVYPNEEPRAHGVGHILGEETYRQYGIKAFGQCDAIFNYGCFHGVVDMAIRGAGLTSNLSRQLFDACEKEMVDPSPCIHPLGHANTILTRYNIVEAFHLCDELYPEPKVAFSCWNGAMMEYINRGAPSAPQDTYGDSSDPYYPCNTLPSKYEASCVSMHTSYLASVWGNDFSKILRYCETYSSVETASQCVDAVGALIAQVNFFNAARIVDECRGAGVNMKHCILGAVTPIAAARQNETVLQLCDAIDSSEDRKLCYDRIDYLL